MPYLVDTDIVIEYLRGNVRVVQALDHVLGRSIFVSWASIAELYEGAFAFANPDEQIRAIRHALDPFDILVPSHAIAIQYGEIRAFLRRRGQLIENFDMLIAATALHHRLTLVTLNRRHFERIPDLRLYTLQ